MMPIWYCDKPKFRLLKNGRVGDRGMICYRCRLVQPNNDYYAYLRSYDETLDHIVQHLANLDIDSVQCFRITNLIIDDREILFPPSKKEIYGYYVS